MTGPLSSTQQQQIATGGRRPPPHPNSILNRQHLLSALDDANISLKHGHLVAFYQSLHRLGYPTLQEFVKIYYEQEEEALQFNKSKLSATTADPKNYHMKWVRPMKNNISQSKNRNRLQLPKPFLDFLETTQDFVTMTSTIHQALTSADGSTTKLAVQLYDGQLVESVIMRYSAPTTGGSSSAGDCNSTSSTPTNQPPPRRSSLCVSSQVGCAMGCTFCATATMGIRGNLTAGEILEQLVHADLFLAKESLERRQQHIQNLTKQHQQQSQKMNPPPQVVLSRNLDLVRNVVFMGVSYVSCWVAASVCQFRVWLTMFHSRLIHVLNGCFCSDGRTFEQLRQCCRSLSCHVGSSTLEFSTWPCDRQYCRRHAPHERPVT
jgi:hypothetical protein